MYTDVSYSPISFSHISPSTYLQYLFFPNTCTTYILYVSAHMPTNRNVFFCPPPLLSFLTFPFFTFLLDEKFPQYLSFPVFFSPLHDWRSQSTLHKNNHGGTTTTTTTTTILKLGYHIPSTSLHNHQQCCKTNKNGFSNL